MSKQKRLSIVRSIVLALAAVVCFAGSANAQGWGVFGGANVNPDQFAFGGSYEMGPMADKIWLQPNGGIGFGNNTTLIVGNFDVVYRVWQQRRGPFRLDVGGGPSINHYRFDGFSETEAGMGLLAALVHANRWSTEFRVGFFDNPEFRVGVGYRFGQGRGRTQARRPRR